MAKTKFPPDEDISADDLAILGSIFGIIADIISFYALVKAKQENIESKKNSDDKELGLY